MREAPEWDRFLCAVLAAHHRSVVRGLSTNILETRRAFPSLAFADDLTDQSRRRVAADS